MGCIQLQILLNISKEVEEYREMQIPSMLCLTTNWYSGYLDR